MARHIRAASSDSRCLPVSPARNGCIPLAVLLVVLLLTPLGSISVAARGVARSPGAEPPRVVVPPTMPDAGQSSAASPAMHRALPIVFEANTGQADPAFRFLAHSQGLTLGLAPDAFALAFASDATDTPMRFGFMGANPAVTLAAAEPLPGMVNYLIGNDPDQWHRGIPTSAKVRYTDLYPGLDLVVYGGDAGRGIEYDIIVAPGADPGAFAFQVSGAETGTKDEATGDLVLTTAAGEVRQHAPALSQERDGTSQTVTGGFALREDGTVGLWIGPYDSALPLVIDPTVVYSTNFGGPGDDAANGVATDGAGNAYIVGTTPGGILITPGVTQPTLGGGTDAFVAKFNPNLSGAASLVYSTYLGGNNDDRGAGIAVNGLNQVYVTGLAFSHNFPTTAGSYQPVFSGAIDAYVVKLTADGSGFVYSTFVGGTGVVTGAGIALDSTGSAYITGSAGMGLPTTAGAAQTAYNGVVSDAFVTKVKPDGSGVVYATYLGGSFEDDGYGIEVDAFGNAYVTGTTRGGAFPIVNGFQPTYGGGFFTGFVTKLNASGTAFVYSTYLGGNGVDTPRGIAVDMNNNAYVAGYTSSANFPTTPGAYQTSFNGSGTAIFLTKLNPSATGASSLTYSTFFGQAGPNDGAFGIVVDPNDPNEAYLTGVTTGALPTTADAFQPTFGGTSSGDSNAFVAKFNPSAVGSAQLVSSSYLGGAGNAQGNAIAVTGGTTPTVFLAGKTNGGHFPVTSGAVQPTSGGGDDGVVVGLRFPASGKLKPTVTASFSPNPAMLGQDVTLTITVSGAGPVPTGIMLIEHGDYDLTNGQLVLGFGKASQLTQRTFSFFMKGIIRTKRAASVRH